ncbi:MAG: Cysteine desulfurase SufS [Mycoplasmataceae bacterium]|nr:MAG: Cysteine desulfurase SufS [Mycoplasmataceae bacterium]
MKKYFPTLKTNKQNVYLDNAATSLKIKSVIKSTIDYYKNFSLNPHSFSNNNFHFELKKNIDETRSFVSNWINCEYEEVIFTPSTTYSLNLLSLSFSQILNKKDSIFITKLEHSSNVYPWMSACKKTGSKLKYLLLNDDFTINENYIIKNVENNTKIVSFSHISNNLGVINDVKKITKLIKEKNPNCFVIIDVCQSIAHEKIDVKDWGIDALVFSAHKLYGPTGIGVLWVKKDSEKKIPHLLWGGGKDQSPLEIIDKNSENSLTYSKFEVGTLPLSQLFGLREVFIFLNNLDWSKQLIKEKNLRNYAVKRLSEIKNIVIYNKDFSSSIILFNILNFHSHDVSNYLAKNNIFVRGGSFCSPFLKELIGVSSATRVSLAIYNDKSDIDKLVNCLKLLNEKEISLLF